MTCTISKQQGGNRLSFIVILVGSLLLDLLSLNCVNANEWLGWCSTECCSLMIDPNCSSPSFFIPKLILTCFVSTTVIKEQLCCVW
ncbi:hypothetical protein [Candidatus Hodgkinia cicadicola]|uniref:hypothetical protein n=1 Tax=Candidatus Hodgkinia cicadicola TaxID=573658 RepID=UPI001788DFDE